MNNPETFSYVPVRGPQQSEALGGCLVCLCLRPALTDRPKFSFCSPSTESIIFKSIRTREVSQTGIQRNTFSTWHTHTHPFNGPLSGTTQVSRYQKGKTNLDFTETRDSDWQWHQLVHVQVCTLLQTDNHASTSPLSFLQAGCPSCRPTNSVRALKAVRDTGLHLKPCSQQTSSTELQAVRQLHCSQSTSWRCACPITRRVTGSTWCIGQFSSV